MSERLVSAVFDSSLPAWLKRYAAIMASFAAEDGSKIFPSLARVAVMAGRSARATQTALTELCRRGVLEVEVGRAPHRVTRYRLNAMALPLRGDGPLPYTKYPYRWLRDDIIHALKTRDVKLKTRRHGFAATKARALDGTK